MRLSVGADTNVLFSGLYYGRSAAPLIEAIRFYKVEFFQSEYLRDELIQVSRRNRMPLRLLELLYSLGNVHVIRDYSYYSAKEFEAARKLVRDEKDVPVYVFAKKMLSAGKIEYFVSGDSDLLTDAVRKSVSNKIISLREFNAVLDKASDED